MARRLTKAYYKALQELHEHEFVAAVKVLRDNAEAKLLPDAFINTVSGHEIRPTKELNIGTVTIMDIASALGNKCRFGGHMQKFYSVAEHSMHVAEMLPLRYRLQALMHDAAEAYLADIPRPFKAGLFWLTVPDSNHIQSFETVEAHVLDQIFCSLEIPSITYVGWDLIKQADGIMLCAEAKHYMIQTPTSWPQKMECLDFAGTFYSYSPMEARRNFLLYYQRTKQLLRANEEDEDDDDEADAEVEVEESKDKEKFL